MSLQQPIYSINSTTQTPTAEDIRHSTFQNRLTDASNYPERTDLSAVMGTINDSFTSANKRNVYYKNPEQKNSRLTQLMFANIDVPAQIVTGTNNDIITIE
jgi:hypothetical protein